MTRRADRSRHLDTVWEEVKKAYTPEQVALFEKYRKSGFKGFHVVRSAEASPAGASKERPSRFKPSRAPEDGEQQ